MSGSQSHAEDDASFWDLAVNVSANRDDAQLLQIVVRNPLTMVTTLPSKKCRADPEAYRFD